MIWDVVIVGAGLAGASAAWSLSRDMRVLVLEAGNPASGASGISTGTANPLMSLRARPVWRMEEAVAALDALIEELDAGDLVRRDGLLRPAVDLSQAEAFEQTSREFPRHATWLDAGAAAERYPDVRAPFGALWNGTAITIPIPKLVHHMLDHAVARGATIRSRTVLTGWKETAGEVIVRVASAGEAGRGEEIVSRKLLLTVGRDYLDFPELERLRLHAVKGQLVRVGRSPELRDLPNLAGRGYVLVEPDALLLGSTYEHSFCDLRPDPERSREILRTTAEMVPALAEAPMLEELAGVRVTVPGIRLPMVGPLPGRTNVWVFTGLGSKGLLMAPLVSRTLREFLTAPDAIPREIAVRIRKDARTG